MDSVRMQMFNGVLNRDDVVMSFTIHFIDQSGQVVDLPEPVGPVTSTRPRVLCVNSPTTSGSPS